MMRIRQIKPAFWNDVVIAELPPSVRLTYIGLWMIADDGGWFRADPPQIANELYGYEPRRRREVAVTADIEALAEAGRVVVHACGHAQIPHFSAHQRLAGETRRVLTIAREHNECPPIPANPRASPLVPDPFRFVSVRNGSSRARPADDRGAAAPDGAAPSEFQARVPRPGKS